LLFASAPCGHSQTPGIAEKPYRGWTSFSQQTISSNFLTQANISAQSDALLSSGLQTHGFDFINIDSGWQGSFDANGRYSSIIVRSDLAKYASNNRLQTSPAEDKATVQGAIGFFGTYTVNEADRSYTVRVDGSSYPNWNGTDRKQVVESITADELKIENPAPSIGGPPTQLTYRRVK